MDIVPPTETLRESLAMVLRKGEELLDDELPGDDRTYLIEILASEECLRLDPVEAVREASNVFEHKRYSRDPTDRNTEMLRWQKVAHQSLVSAGWLPMLIGGHGVTQMHRLHTCLEFSHDAFDQLAHLWNEIEDVWDGNEKKRYAQLKRFRDDNIRYVDILLGSREAVTQEMPPSHLLRTLSDFGSNYASPRILRRRH